LEKDIAVSADDYHYRATVALVLANERRRRSAHAHREAWTAARYRAIPIRRESPPLCPFRPPQQQQDAETGASCALELASLSPQCEIAEVTDIRGISHPIPQLLARRGIRVHHAEDAPPFKRSTLPKVEIDVQRRLAQQAITTAHHPEY